MAGSVRGKFTYDYPRPALTVDVAVVTREARPRVLLIQRAGEPFKDKWALPGGFAEPNERLIDSAKRELIEETGIDTSDLEQLYTAGDPGRDPRGWTVSVAFLARVEPGQLTPIAGDDAKAVKWFFLDRLPKLAFDHGMLLTRLKNRLNDRMA